MLYSLRKYQQSLEISRDMISLLPNEPFGFYMAAKNLHTLDRFEEALNMVVIAVGLNPDNASYHELHSNILLSSPIGSTKYGTQLALNAAKESVRLAPLNVDSICTLAMAKRAVGEISGAKIAMKNAVDLDPNNSRIWTNVSILAIQIGDYKVAKHACLKALSLNPNEYGALNTLGIVFERKRQYDISAVAFYKAAEIGPMSHKSSSNIELIGFKKLRRNMRVLIFPLVFQIPLYVIANSLLSKWLDSKHDQLLPKARKIGLKLATSERSIKKYHKNINRPKLSEKGSEILKSWEKRKFIPRKIYLIPHIILFLMMAIGIYLILLTFTEKQFQQLFLFTGLLIFIPSFIIEIISLKQAIKAYSN